MRVKDAIAKSMNEYPSLYLYPDYESCVLRVLDHWFGTLGSGYRWAHVKDKTKGGYMCQAKHRKVKGEWDRIYDKPYGKECCDVDVIRMIKEDIVEVRPAIPRLGNIHQWFFKDDFAKVEAEYRSKEHHGMIDIDNEETYKDKIHIDNVIESNIRMLKFFNIGDIKYEETRYYAWSPYPYWEEEYCPFYKEDARYIQEDWRIAALWWSSKCIDFYKEDRIKLLGEKDRIEQVMKDKEVILDFYKKTIDYVVNLKP